MGLSMRRIDIEHITKYQYSEPVQFLPHKLYVRPREGHDIRIESSSLSITPAFDIDWQRDLFGNSVAIVKFREGGALLEIVSRVVVQHYADQSAPFSLAENACQFPFHYDPNEQIDLSPYQMSVFPQDFAAVGAWLNDVWNIGARVDTVTLLNKINEKVASTIGYVVRAEPGVQSPNTTLTLGKGSCRDTATLFIEACRFCGLASRFVSGYLVSNAAVEDQATTHAWSEVYLPGTGWLGFDSTSGQIVGGDHIAVAVHRHPEVIPPVSGQFIGPPKVKGEMLVEVHVNILGE
jgi:transglutaminase-like putative cysteine protease